ncbi:16S rRNA (cytosine(1402)-N(4))-methyltransferase [bacterium]|nr:16S rRNA (cytosine(1402)-N(4))-methyltransferase [bacterium]|tara:strand:- start:3426 stop:4304 length:879 start_codon:yes stop_codon:yes gene_type:complete
MSHIPVLLNEVIEFLNPRKNENFIDCTLGAGGHAKEILSYTKPNGKLLGIDLDEDTIKLVKKNLSEFGKRVIFHKGNFANLLEIIREYDFKAHGILLDLGMSSMQITQTGKGFSFRKNELLDMRFGNSRTTAHEIINKYSEKRLGEIFKNYGDEPAFKEIAKAIFEKRQDQEIKTTKDLVHIIVQTKLHCKYRGRKTHLHPATRVFQSLRIAVNDEINNLIKVLPQAVSVLAKNGRLAVISFHSKEDRIVKNFFRYSNGLEILTKKPIQPSMDEIRKNTRSRSAKLRAVKKI